jgi:hypothetical protein
VVTQHQLSCFAPDSVTTHHDISFLFRSVLQHNSSNSLFWILVVILHSAPQMNWNLQLVSDIVEHDFMQLAAMSIEYWRSFILDWRFLVDHDLTGIPLVDIEPVARQVDAERSHATRYFSILPAMEDAACIGTKTDDISQGLQFWEVFIDYGIVTLALALNRCSKSAEAWEVLNDAEQWIGV